jgi:FAD-linked sulfhydryl oxidase
MPRRQHLNYGFVAAAFLCITLFFLVRHSTPGAGQTDFVAGGDLPLDKTPIVVSDAVLNGAATAPKLENATLKYVSSERVAVLGLC